MKKIVILPFLISSLVISSIFFATPARADAGTDTACTLGPLIPGIGALVTFGCLGKAVNTQVMGLAEDLAEVMTRHTGDFVESLINAISVAIGGATDPKTGGLFCLDDNYCPTEQKCDLDPTHVAPNPIKTYKTCVPRSTSEREKYLAAITTNPYLRGGAIGSVGRVTDGVYSNPLRLTARGYFQSVLANNILTPQPAYGQSSSVALLDKAGMQDLWRFFRNLSYIGLAVVLAIFGLMVMFRAKTDPRTVVTFQMALPSVAVALVLIYLSYPLAGFLMDIGGVLTGFFKNMWASLSGFGGGMPMDPDFGGIFVNFVTKGLRIDIGGGVIDMVVGLVLRIWAIFIGLGILLTIVSRYAMLFVQLIMAPPIFALSALPGRQDMATRWIKSFLVNVLVFPGIYFIVNMANYIRIISDTGGSPLSLPSWFSPEISNVGGLVALGLLSQAPKIPAMLEELFDIIPGAHASRAGVDLSSSIRGIPIIGGLAGIG